MRFILVVATSNNGFITNGDDPNPGSWTSNEDKKLYNDLLSKHKFYVMGYKTFIAINAKHRPDVFKLVLSKNPKYFKHLEISGQIEFNTLTPKQIKNTYENIYDTCLILGGSYVFTDFLTADLIDEIYLTVEPTKFKSGTPLLRNGKSLSDFNLPKPKTTNLNNNGSILKHYILKK